jgi:hypothetical protein
MAELTQPLVLDATVLSDFASSGSVEWMSTLVERPVTVPAVRTELRREREHGHRFLDSATEHDGTLATDDLPARRLAADVDPSHRLGGIAGTRDPAGRPRGRNGDRLVGNVA